MALTKIGAAITLDGEKEYRQAITDINKSMSVLKSELKLTSAEFDGQANSIDALKSRNKILTGMYEDQAKKISTMNGALESATKTYGANSKEAQDWQIKLNNAQAELTKLDKELKTNESHLKEAERSTDGCAKSIDEYGREVKQAKTETLTFGDVLKANLTSDVIIAGVKALGHAMKQVGDAAINTVRDTASYADNILTMSNNTGLATDTLQELQYMQELTDVSMEQVTSSMVKQIKSMDNAKKGSKDYADAYAKLGVEITDANGELKDSEKVYWNVIDALGKVQNETERDALAMKLFGKSAQDLNSIVKIGSEGVAQFAQEARDMGAVLDAETLGKLGETDDAFQRIDQSLEIFKRELGIAMSPSITRSIDKVVDKFTEMGDEVGDVAGGAIEMLADGLVWIMDNADLIISTLTGIGAGFLAFKSASLIQVAIDKLTMLSTVASGASGVMGKLWAVMSGNPIAMASVAFGALASAIAFVATRTDKAKTETDLLRESFKKTIKEAEESAQKTRELFAEQDKKNEDSEAEVAKYKLLSDRLYDLADVEEKSNEQKREMQMLVGELNEAFPELGLTIDSITGIINKQREEVDKLIDSYIEEARVNSAKQDIQLATNAEYEANKKLLALENDRIKAKEDLARAEEEYNKRVNSDYKDALSYTKDILYDDYTKDAVAEIDKFNAKIEEQNVILNDSAERYRFATDYITKYDKSLRTASASTGQLSLTSNTFAKGNSTAISNVKTNFDELIKKYEEVKTAAEESILQQIGLFDEFDEKAKYSKEQILENLQSQIDGMRDWAENMDKASELGVSDQVLEELRSMGIESSGYLAEIVKMTDKQIDELNKKWETKMTIADQVSTEMAKAETNFDLSVANMMRTLNGLTMTSPTVVLNPQRAEEIKNNNVMSDEYKKQQLESPVINVYVGNEQVASVVSKANKANDTRRNPTR